MSERAKELFKIYIKAEYRITVDEYENLSCSERQKIMREFIVFAAKIL